MPTLNGFLAKHRMVHVTDLDRWLRMTGRRSETYRTQILKTLCDNGTLVRVRRGLYAQVGTNAAADPYELATSMMPDALMAGRTALDVRNAVPPDRRSKVCIVFTKAISAGRGLTWQGVTMRPIRHPAALVRTGRCLVETEPVANNGGRPLRTASVERAFVDMLERPRMNGGWHELMTVVTAVPSLDLDRTVWYLKQLENATTAAKLGWILERHNERFGVGQQVLSSIERMRPRGPHYLSRTHRQSGRLLRRWNLVVPPEFL